MKRYLIIALIFLLVGTLSVMAWYTEKGKLPLPTSSSLSRSGFAKFLSKKIASLTTPATKIVGRVDKLDGDVLTVTQRFPEGDRTFKVSITKDTQIIKPRPFIPYLLKTVHADVADLQTRADLTEGTLVTVTNPVPASVVEITIYNTSIQGTISEVRGNTFTMNAAVPLLPPNIPTTQLEQAKERTYTVTYTTGSTELSRKKGGEPIKVHPDELKVGAVVTVYATTDVTLLTSVPAVLIRFADL